MWHVVVLLAVVTMVELGFWQLRRLHTVRVANAAVRSSLARPEAPIDQVLPLGAPASQGLYRRVEVTGRYDRVSEILLANRSFEGSAGSDLLTPLVTPEGRAVIVDRGWVPLDLKGADEEQARPPIRNVTVTGALFPSEHKGYFSPSIPPGGRLTSIPRIDVARITEQLPYPAYPLYLRLETQSPAQPGALPEKPGPLDLSEGPHLSYAVQWFIFATIAVLTYGAVLMRKGGRR